MFFLNAIAFLALSAFSYEYGIDQIEESSVVEKLQDKRLAVLAHAASVDRQGNHLIDLLYPRYDLRKIFVPEHGLRSINDGWIQDGSDEKTGLPILSLYQEKSRAPKPEDLANIDAIVMDLQDVGVRYYTYFSTVAEFIKVATSLNKEVILLDRPNPVGGDRVEGEVLSSELRGKFISYYDVPTRHGMTLGELSKMFVTESGLNTRLSVIPVRGWKRESLVGVADRPWIPSSPALLTLEQVYLYTLWGSLEHFNLAVGRGKTNELAFRVIAAPWITRKEASEMAASLNSIGWKGITFMPYTFTATRDIYLGQKVNGIVIALGKGYEEQRSDEFTYEISRFLKNRFALGDRLVFSKFASNYYGSEQFVEAIQNSVSWKDYSQKIDQGIFEFSERRKSFLLYESQAAQ
jgi:uncharacterized protein YbbC (DUF1343 family)